ncbi:hypothetical protein Taro_022430 [Colocasia esculenta]|uniref:Uncharacterized protein n=1 Tax=Colocasia esculenta TaxID=4460 RepID=A0A843UUE7_COLES|nr:hypothetical protein [Colocasia esculenta]
MELSSVRWISDLGMDDPTFIGQCELSSLDQITSQHIAAAFGDDFQSSFSSESYTSYPTFTTPHRSTAANTFSCSSMEASRTGGGAAERPAKLLETSGWCSRNAADQVSAAAAVPDASSPSILSFGANQEAASGPPHFLRGFVGAPAKPKEEMGFSINQATKRAYESMAVQGAKRINGGSRPPSHAQDHIIAERKRREKLSQRFIALSAIVPGLKKMDKASVLGDAIKYMKQLQERVKALEEQSTKSRVESAVLVKKSQLPVDDDTSSSDENFDGSQRGKPMPEIEAKLSDKSVLVRIHCEKRSGVLVKVLSEIEKLHLTVVNTSSIPFAGSSLDITTDEEFSMSLKDLVKHLNTACRQFV